MTGEIATSLENPISCFPCMARKNCQSCLDQVANLVLEWRICDPPHWIQMGFPFQVWPLKSFKPLHKYSSTLAAPTSAKHTGQVCGIRAQQHDSRALQDLSPGLLKHRPAHPSHSSAVMHWWLTVSIGPETSHFSQPLTSQKSSPSPPICTLLLLWAGKKKQDKNVIKKIKNWTVLFFCPSCKNQQQFIQYSMRWLSTTKVHLSPQSYALFLLAWKNVTSAFSQMGCCEQHTSVLTAKEAVHFYPRLSIQKRKNCESQVLLFSHEVNSPRSAPGRFWLQRAGLAVKINWKIFTVILRDTKKLASHLEVKTVLFF